MDARISEMSSLVEKAQWLEISLVGMEANLTGILRKKRNDGKCLWEVPVLRSQDWLMDA